MNKEQAFNVISNALNAATQRGSFNLADAELVINAINTLAGELGLERKSAEPEAEEKAE